MIEREVVNGLMYILSTGCHGASLPKDLPVQSTVNDYFCRWAYDGTPNLIHQARYMQCREQVGREASPTACRTLTVKASRSLKKGDLICSGFRYGKENQGQEAP